MTDPLTQWVEASFDALAAIEELQAAEWELRKWVDETTDRMVERLRAEEKEVDREWVEREVKRLLVDPERAAQTDMPGGSLKEILDRKRDDEPDDSEAETGEGE